VQERWGNENMDFYRDRKEGEVSSVFFELADE
jgi:hypothetical protein